MVIAETGGGKASHYVFFLIYKGHWLSLQRENAQVSKILVYLHFHCHPRPSSSIPMPFAAHQWVAKYDQDS